jgi:hypothetical protein
VPGFAMRDKPGGPWRWRIRWSPRRPGRWFARVVVETGHGKQEVAVPQPIDALVDARLEGPLLPAETAAPGYLRRLQADGTSEPIWLFGACRAWNVRRKPGVKQTGWAWHSSIDRETELFAPMRGAGFNLLNQWMAPWEFFLVHHDRAEHWRRRDGTWRRHALSTTEDWQPHRSYDQGRALGCAIGGSAALGGQDGGVSKGAPIWRGWRYGVLGVGHSWAIVRSRARGKAQVVRGLDAIQISLLGLRRGYLFYRERAGCSDLIWRMPAAGGKPSWVPPFDPDNKKLRRAGCVGGVPLVRAPRTNRLGHLPDESCTKSRRSR